MHYHQDEFQSWEINWIVFESHDWKFEPVMVSKMMIISERESAVEFALVMALITVSTGWPFQKSERNETNEQRSAVFETAIECVTG